MDWKTKKEIEDVIDNIAVQSLISGFYPTFVSKQSQYPLADVFSVLYGFTAEKRLYLRWEIHCENYECCRTLATLDNVPEDCFYVECEYCGEENLVCADNLYPKFMIDNEYRKFLQDCKCSVKKNHITLRTIQDSCPVTLSNILDAFGIKTEDSKPPGKAFNIVINNITAQACTIEGQGGNQMGEKTIFSDISVSTKGSAVNIGSDNSIVGFQYAEIERLTDQFIEALRKNQDTEAIMGEVEETLNAVKSHTRSEKIDRSYIGFLKSKVSTIMSTITKSTELISAYEAWRSVLS